MSSTSSETKTDETSNTSSETQTDEMSSTSSETKTDEISIISSGTDEISIISSGTDEISKEDIEKAEKKPLFKLMEKLLDEDEVIDKKLISFHNLSAILKTDFDIDLEDLNEPAIESYIAILKWSLKMWPGWVQVASEEREAQTSVMNKMKVLEGYFSVKKFISYRLRVARRCIEAVENDMATRLRSDKKRPLKKDKELVLRVECSKIQLKYLINSKVSRKLQLINSNIPKHVAEPNRFQWMSFMDIFNWPYLEVHVDLPNFSYSHKNISKSNYRVIDANTADNKKADRNDREIYCKKKPGQLFGMKLPFFLGYLEQVMKYMSDGRRLCGNKKSDLTGLFQEIIKDVSVLKDHITIETVFRYNLSDYNYSQNLSNLVKANQIENDDLYKKYKNVQPRLQHTITPAIEFCLNKFTCPLTVDAKGQRAFKLGLEDIERANNNWLRIHCSLCDIDITGFSNFQQLNTHLAEYHGAESEFQCTNCKNVYNILQLAYRRWRHDCN